MNTVDPKELEIGDIVEVDFLNHYTSIHINYVAEVMEIKYNGEFQSKIKIKILSTVLGGDSFYIDKEEHWWLPDERLTFTKRDSKIFAEKFNFLGVLS